MKKVRRTAAPPAPMGFERLESRLALAGDTVIFYVAGLGGGTFPDRVIGHVNGLIDRSPDLAIEQFFTNWNSPNFDDPNMPAGNPGRFPGAEDLLAMAAAPFAAPFVVASTGAIPFTDESFVDALSSKLQNEYDDDDTIILIGHSFGGDSLLKVANRLEGVRQVDLLATLDPVGFGGFRGDLPNPGSNVKYFFNRWQDILPFPFDFSTTGRLASDATGLTAVDFAVADQDPQSTRRLSDGSPDWHGPTALELSLVLASPQYFKTTFFDPVTEWEDFSKYPLGKTEAKSLTHQYLPLDEYISRELIRIMNGVIPQGPIIEATVSPAGLVDEGTTVRIDASASYDPNVGQTIQDFRWSAPDPRIILQQDSLDLSVVIGDNFDLPDDALTITLEVWDGPRDAPGAMKSAREFTITSRNVAPQNVQIQGPGHYVRAFEVPLTANFADPGSLDSHTAVWSVPGSQAVGGIIQDFPTQPSRTSTARPLYEAEGNYSVQVTVEDDDSGSGQSAAQPLRIDAVGLAANPDDPALQDLLVGGSTGVDAVAVRPGIAEDTYVVLMNGIEYGPFDVTGVIRIAGQGGDDRIEIGAGDLTQLRRPIFLDAGGGSDQVVLIDDGRAAAADYLVTPTSVSITERATISRLAAASTAAFGGLFYTDATERLDVLGTDGVNVFTAQPSLDTTYALDGNGPLPGFVEASKGDYLELDTKTTFPADPRGLGLDTSGRRLSLEARGLGRWDFTKGTGHQPVGFESFERFNHVDVVAAAADAGKTSSSVVHVFDSETLDPLFTIPAGSIFGRAYHGGVRVATGDLDNDGLPDVAVAPGRMAAPVVKVFNGSPQPGLQGTEILNQRISARSTFGVRYAGGVNIAVGDVTGDSLDEVILSRSRGPAVVKVFENSLVPGMPFAQLGQSAARAFNAFPQPRRYQGGSSIAVGDVGGLGKRQILVGSGVGMRGVVRVFDVRMPAATYAALMQVVDPTVPAIRGGLQVAAGDLDGDGRAEIVTGSGAGGGSWVRIYSGADGSHSFMLQTGTRLAATIPARVAVRSLDGASRMAVFATWGADARRGYRVVRMDAPLSQQIDDFGVADSGLSGGGINIG
jgi:hypothetical protein